MDQNDVQTFCGLKMASVILELECQPWTGFLLAKLVIRGCTIFCIIIILMSRSLARLDLLVIFWQRCADEVSYFANEP
jgi:hypothetical protein